jgi:hypothetical protein
VACPATLPSKEIGAGAIVNGRDAGASGVVQAATMAATAVSMMPCLNIASPRG